MNVLCEYSYKYKERFLWLKYVTYFRHKQFAKFRVMITEHFWVNKFSFCFWQPYHIMSFMSGSVLKMILTTAWSYQIPLMVLKFSNFNASLCVAFVLYQHYSFNLIIFILLIHFLKSKLWLYFGIHFTRQRSECPSVCFVPEFAIHHSALVVLLYTHANLTSFFSLLFAT